MWWRAYFLLRCFFGNPSTWCMMRATVWRLPDSWQTLCSAYSASLWAGKPSGPGDVLTKYVFRVEYQQGWLGPPTLSSTNIHDDIAEQTCSDPLPFKNDGGQPVNLACMMVRATWLQFEAGVSWVHMYIYIYKHIYLYIYIAIGCWRLVEINGNPCRTAILCVLFRPVVFAPCEHTKTWEGGNQSQISPAPAVFFYGHHGTKNVENPGRQQISCAQHLPNWSSPVVANP